VTSDAQAPAHRLTPSGDPLGCRLFLLEMVFLYLAWLFVPVLSNFLSGTCALKFRRLSEFRILFLDKRNQIIADEVQQKGTWTTHRSMCARW
jgi:hypothetical protein